LESTPRAACAPDKLLLVSNILIPHILSADITRGGTRAAGGGLGVYLGVVLVIHAFCPRHRL